MENQDFTIHTDMLIVFCINKTLYSLKSCQTLSFGAPLGLRNSNGFQFHQTLHEGENESFVVGERGKCYLIR